ncbi:MAG: hypothetical protein ABI317_16145, partial [Gaiellales bacterium]
MLARLELARRRPRDVRVLTDRRTLLRQAGGLVLGAGAIGPLAARASGAAPPLPALRGALTGDLIARGAPGYA